MGEIKLPNELIRDLVDDITDTLLCGGIDRYAVESAVRQVIAAVEHDRAGRVLARGWYQFLPGENGEPDDYDVYDIDSGAGKDCVGCIPILIVRDDGAHGIGEQAKQETEQS